MYFYTKINGLNSEDGLNFAWSLQQNFTVVYCIILIQTGEDGEDVPEETNQEEKNNEDKDTADSEERQEQDGEDDPGFTPQVCICTRYLATDKLNLYSL